MHTHRFRLFRIRKVEQGEAYPENYGCICIFYFLACVTGLLVLIMVMYIISCMPKVFYFF